MLTPPPQRGVNVSGSSSPHVFVLLLIFAVLLVSILAYAATITVNQLPIITNNRTPLLNVTFNETVNRTWFSIDNGTNTTACYNCTNFTTILNQEFPQNATGLVGWWKFNEGSGNQTSDSSGMGNTGNLTNMNPGIDNCTGNCSGWTSSGKFGNALQFDGVNDYVDAGNGASLNIINAITIEAWVKPMGFTSNSYQAILWKTNVYDGSQNAGYGLVAYWSTWQPAFFATTSMGNGMLAAANTYMTLGNWQHIVVTYDSATNTTAFYRNGVPDRISTTGVTGTINITLSPVQIGVRQAWYWNGSIDEVRIYNRSLSATEVYNDYALSAGQHNITIYANDSSGNINTTLKQFVVDFLPPVLSFANPTPNNGTLNQSWAFINITSDKNLSTAILEWNGVNETMQGSNTNFYVNKTWLLGNYTFRVYANDTLNNRNITETRAIVKSMSSTANISHMFEFNGSYFILTPDTGAANFTFEAPIPSRVRVTDNTKVVVSYNNGTIFRVAGWNLSYINGNITLTANLSKEHNYIMLDYSPIQENISTGAYGDFRNQTDVDIFANSNFDWYWYQSYHGANATYARNLTTSGKNVLLRVWWWDNPALSNKNWTDLYNNETLFNATISEIRSQIDYVGNNSFYAMTLSEEEPTTGYNHYSLSGTVNETHYINVSNRIYAQLKTIYPNMKILLGTHVMSVSASGFSNLLRYGIMDDWYASLTTGSNNMSAWYDRLVAEQANYSDVYALIWAGSNLAGYESLTPAYTQDAFNLARSKGIKNIGFFPWDSSSSTNILFNNYPFNASKPDYNRSELYKESVSKMAGLYSANDIGGIYSGNLLQQTVEPGGSIAYSRVIVATDNKANFTIMPSSDSLNVTLANWTQLYKKWNELSPNSSVSSSHVIGDFPANTKIIMKKNSAYWNTFTSNSSGYINFTYSEGYSNIQFEALQDTTLPTVSLSLSSSSIYTGNPITISCSASDNYQVSSTSLTVTKPGGYLASASCGQAFTDTSFSGTYTATYSATDTSGNSASTSQAFTVNSYGGGSGGITATQNKTNQTTKNVTVTIPTTANATNTTTTPQELEIKQKAQGKISEVKAKAISSEAQAKLSEAEAAYAAGQYDKAYSLAAEAEGLTRTVEARKEPEAQRPYVYVIAVIVLAIAAYVLSVKAKKKGRDSEKTSSDLVKHETPKKPITQKGQKMMISTTYRSGLKR